MKKIIPILVILGAIGVGFGTIYAMRYFQVAPEQPIPSGPSIALDSTLVVRLERTRCYGVCPAYSVTVYGDGRVEFFGQKYVQVEGEASSTITSQQLQELVSAINRVDYFTLKDSYRETVTDLSGTKISVTSGQYHKVISDYSRPDGYDTEGLGGPPKELKDLELTIDRVANTKQWIGNCKFTEGVWTCAER